MSDGTKTWNSRVKHASTLWNLSKKSTFRSVEGFFSEDYWVNNSSKVTGF